MSGIEQEIERDSRTSLIDKHLPGTEKSQRELQKEGIVYLFNDRQTLERVASEILQNGEQTGESDEGDPYERYGIFFSQAIGYILKLDGTQIPLHYGEIKIKKSTGKYHVIPRTKPRKTKP